MTFSGTAERSLGLAVPDLVAGLAGTLDALVDQPLVGRALFGGEWPAVGRYTIERRLGAGATAIVYAARDTTLDRPVALKIMALRDVDGAWRARAHREARALARLSHANVVAVHDVGEWRSHPFIAMELVAGATLARWQAEKPRAWPAILRHYLAAGRGLEAAHSVGLVHRDFKPANVLVADSGRVVVTDFGLAAVAEHAADRAAAVAGVGAGTPAYLAPEQREGAPPQPSADVYSFSVALCEALAGRHPWLDPAFDWRSVPGSARAAIARGMAAHPAQRWPRMGPLLAAIEAALPAPTTGRRRAAGVAIVLATGLAGDGAGSAPARGDQASPASTSPPDAPDASAHVAIARGLAADDPTAAAALLRESPASQRGDDWLTAARAVLLRPIARELRCFDGAPPPIASVAHGMLAAVDARGRAIVCELAAERVAPLAGGAICARVLDADHVGVLTGDDQLAIFDRRAGWQSRVRIPLGPPPPDAPQGGSRCERDLAVVGLHALALRRGGAWQVVDLDDLSLASVAEAGDAPHEPVAISRDRRRALVRSASSDVSLVPLGEPVASIAPVAAAPWQLVAHDPASDVAVVAGREAGTVIDVGRGAVLRHEHLGLDVGPSVLALAPGGHMAVAATYRGALLWWPLAGDARAPWLELVSEKPIVQLAFNRAGTRLVWRDSFGGGGVRDVGHARGHELPLGGRFIRHVTFATDDRVVGVSSEGRVLAWDLAEERAFVAGHHDLSFCQPSCGKSSPAIWSAAVHPDGSVAATAGRDGTVGVWPLGRGPSQRAAMRLPIGPERRSFSVLFAGDLLLVGNRDPVAQIWNWRTGALLADLGGHETWVYALAAARRAGSTTFVTGSRGWTDKNDGALRFWSEGGSLLATLVVGSAVNDLAVSPSGRLVAAALSSGGVLIGEVQTGAVVARVIAHEGWTRRVAFVDEASVISAGDDGVVQRIAIRTGRIAASIHAHPGQKIYDMDLRGDALLTASHDGTVRQWDLRDGSRVRTYAGHKKHVLTVRWHADGKRFVSGDGDTEIGGGDQAACIWRIDRDTCQDWLIGHRDDVRAAQFIDETRVMTASFDGTARVWTPASSATAKDLAAELERRAPACLDEQQRVAYLGEAGREATARARAGRRAAR